MNNDTARLANIFILFGKQSDRLGEAISRRGGTHYTDVLIYLSGWMLVIRPGSPTFWTQAGYCLLECDYLDFGYAIKGDVKDILSYGEHGHTLSPFSMRDSRPQAINCVRAAQRILKASGVETSGRTPDDLAESLREGVRTGRIIGTELKRPDSRPETDHQA